jgi:hypothetical protein
VRRETGKKEGGRNVKKGPKRKEGEGKKGEGHAS